LEQSEGDGIEIDETLKGFHLTGDLSLNLLRIVAQMEVLRSKIICLAEGN
jgi:hypothetical protein